MAYQDIVLLQIFFCKKINLARALQDISRQLKQPPGLGAVLIGRTLLDLKRRGRFVHERSE